MDYLRKLGLSGLIIAIFFGASLALFFNNSLRAPFRQWFEPPDRKILSIASGRIFPNREFGRVLKILTAEDGMILEVYREPTPGESLFVEKILLGKQKDAYFQFQARATNLALKDMDGDNIFEIIAPSLDSSLLTHLNIFRYNVSTGHFEPYLE